MSSLSQHATRVFFGFNLNCKTCFPFKFGDSLSDVAETWWDAGGIFVGPDTDSFFARCQNREKHSPLAIHTAEFVHVLVLLAAGFALCFGESINLT